MAGSLLAAQYAGLEQGVTYVNITVLICLTRPHLNHTHLYRKFCSRLGRKTPRQTGSTRQIECRRWG